MSEGTLTRDQIDAIALAGERLAVALAAHQEPGFRGMPLTRAEVILTAGSLRGLLGKLPRILKGPDGSGVDFLPVARGVIALMQLAGQVQAWGVDAGRPLPKAGDILKAVAALWGTKAELVKIGNGQAAKPSGGRIVAAAVTGDEGEPLPDGPEPPDGFNHAGKTHHGLARKPFLALSFLWGRRNKTAHRDYLAGPVWGDHATTVAENAVESLRTEVNDFFAREQIEWHATIQGDYLSLRQGLPRERKASEPPKPDRPKAKRRSR